MRFLLASLALLTFPALATPALAVPTRHPVPHGATAPAKADWLHTVVATPEGGMRMGNPAAPVKLIEYGARTCPICARFSGEGVPALEKTYIATGKVSWEFRDFPVHGAIDLGPILLGHCVSNAQFFPLLDAMMANQRTLIGRETPIPDADQAMLQKAKPAELATYLAKFYGYLDLVKARGLPEAKARACLASQPGIDAIVKHVQAASQITGTPTFIINGKTADKVYTWDVLEPLIRAALGTK